MCDYCTILHMIVPLSCNSLTSPRELTQRAGVGGVRAGGRWQGAGEEFVGCTQLGLVKLLGCLYKLLYLAMYIMYPL